MIRSREGARRYWDIVNKEHPKFYKTYMEDNPFSRDYGEVMVRE